MKFIILREGFYVDEIPFLKDSIISVSNGENNDVIYEADERVRDKLKVFAEAGFIKEIKNYVKEIKTVDDIIRHTEEVILLEGGSVHMKVKLLGKEIRFSESQLLNSLALRRQLLRFKEVVVITQKEWIEILCYWFGIAKELNEPSEEEEIITKVLNYLDDCVIFKDVNYCRGMFSLYFDSSHPDCVFCLIDDLVEFLKYENRRRLRTILSDYIRDNRKFSVNGKRKRFWGFAIQKTEINFENQLKKEDVEEGDGQ